MTGICNCGRSYRGLYRGMCLGLEENRIRENRITEKFDVDLKRILLKIIQQCSASSLSSTSLVFDSVGRGHIGSYMCIASNGVPPSISKRVDLRVQCNERMTPQLVEISCSSPAHDDGTKSAGRSSAGR